jgi:hypothetical protein
MKKRKIFLGLMMASASLVALTGCENQNDDKPTTTTIEIPDTPNPVTNPVDNPTPDNPVEFIILRYRGIDGYSDNTMKKISCMMDSFSKYKFSSKSMFTKFYKILRRNL